MRRPIETIESIFVIQLTTDGLFFTFDELNANAPMFHRSVFRAHQFNSLESAEKFLASDYCKKSFADQFDNATIRKVVVGLL